MDEANLVFRHKSTNPQYRSMVHSEVKTVGDPDDLTLRFRTTDETVDRYGDIVRATGADFTNYNKAPRVLWNHHKDLPIGKSVKHEIIVPSEKSKGDDMPHVIQDFQFMSEQTNAFAFGIFKMVRDNFINTTSIGFRPKKTSSPETEEERAEMGLGPHGVEYLKWELLETSVVTIPANPNAVQLAHFDDMLRKGALSRDEMDLFEAMGELSEAMKARWNEIKGVTYSIPKLETVIRDSEGFITFEGSESNVKVRVPDDLNLDDNDTPAPIKDNHLRRMAKYIGRDLIRYAENRSMNCEDRRLHAVQQQVAELELQIRTLQADNAKAVETNALPSDSDLRSVLSDLEESIGNLRSQQGEFMSFLAHSDTPAAPQAPSRSDSSDEDAKSHLLEAVNNLVSSHLKNLREGRE